MGSKLICALKQSLEKSKVDGVVLYVALRNLPAKKLYTAHGFKQVKGSETVDEGEEVQLMSWVPGNRPLKTTNLRLDDLAVPLVAWDLQELGKLKFLGYHFLTYAKQHLLKRFPWSSP